MIGVWLLLLNACGFQLRGAVALNWSKIHLQSTAADRVTGEVQQILKEEGINLVSTPQAAQLVVHLSGETVDRRVLSVSAVSGKMQEIELNYRVAMAVYKPDNSVLLETQVINLSRDYTFDETAVLAMGDEENVLREELLRDLVAQVVRRLQTIKL